jgi:hypothetical protein
MCINIFKNKILETNHDFFQRFLKTFNKVKWDFLFDYMGKLSILEEFISKTKIVFIGTKNQW